MASVSVQIAIEAVDRFERASGRDDAIIKDPRKNKQPEVVWLPEVEPSPANFARAMQKLASVPKHRGLVLSPQALSVSLCW